MITPIIAQPTPVAMVRGIAEECRNALDAANASTLMESPIPLPDGSFATISCRRTKRGIDATVKISRKKPVVYVPEESVIQQEAIAADAKGNE